jgi:hypothetical protein
MFALQSQLLQDQIADNKKQVAQANLFPAEIRSLSLPIPPFNEQIQIVAIIKSAFAVIDEIEQSKTGLQTALISAKSKILSLAVSGNLVPQDESDEPAAVLLDRIRAERARLVKEGKIKPDKRGKDAAATRDNSHYEKLPVGWEVATVDGPEELIISREEFDDIEEKIGEILSALEWQVLMAYLDGKSHQEMAAELRRHVKSIDNALQRVKRKLERYLESRAELNYRV